MVENINSPQHSKHNIIVMEWRGRVYKGKK